MRERQVAAAVAGLVGAVIAHALDTAGLLPGVHETAAVRGAMSPLLTAGWLVAAAGLGWLAAATRPLLLAPASALLVSACPELVGRHDPGALAEPGALAGALLQALLVLAVLALGVVAARPLTVLRTPQPTRALSPRPAGVRRSIRTRRATRCVRPRAPPQTSSCSRSSDREEGHDKNFSRPFSGRCVAEPARHCRGVRRQLERR